MVASVMWYASITSLAVCVSLARAQHEYVIGENRYCKEYHDPLPGVKPELLSHHECQEKCDNRADCQGFLMSCATLCYLFAGNCTTVVSSCYSYVGVKSSSLEYKESFLKDPWQDVQFKVAFAVCIVCIVMSSCLFAVSTRPEVFLRDHSLDGPRGAAKIPDSRFRGAASFGYAPIQPVVDENPIVVANPIVSPNKPLEAYLERRQRNPNAELACDVRRERRLPTMNPDVVAAVKSNTKKEQAFDTKEIQLLWVWRLRIVLVAASVILFIVVIDGMRNFPNDGDHQRGICGLVHQDLSPYGWWDTFILWTPWLGTDNQGDHNLLVNGEKFPTLSELPQDCAKVYGTDVVDEHTGPGCQNWCAKVTGNSFRFACSFPASNFAHVYTVCNKVFVWTKLSWLPPVLGTIIAVMVGALFGVAAYVHAKYYQVPLGEATLQHRNMDKPSSNMCTVFTSGRHKLPFCFASASSDAEVFRTQLWVALSGFFFDIAGDVNSSINFLLRGEFIYSLSLTMMAFLPNLHNLFQSEGIAACLLSFTRGFPTRDVYLLQRREGAHEGIYSLLLGVFILMRGAYFQSFQDSLVTLFSISFVVCTSVLSSLPHAGAASLVLQIEDLDFAEFARVERIRDTQSCMRFFPVLDGLALAVALGRTFCSFWLAFALWWIGILIGVIGTFMGCVVDTCVTPCFCCSTPDRRSLWQLTLAFVFWPFSAVRLAVSRNFYEEMEHGKANIFFVCSRGCASLPPLAFYAHRWVTLITFWIFTMLRPDSNLYVDSFTIVWSLTSETLHKLLLVFLFLIGWSALILSMGFFFWFQEHLEDAYWRSGDFTDQDYAALTPSLGGTHPPSAGLTE